MAGLEAASGHGVHGGCGLQAGSPVWLSPLAWSLVHHGATTSNDAQSQVEGGVALFEKSSLGATRRGFSKFVRIS